MNICAEVDAKIEDKNFEYQEFEKKLYEIMIGDEKRTE